MGCGLSFPRTTVDSELSCSDFLADWGKKPETLTFAGCDRIENEQADKLVANYTVSGAEAEAVENFLQTEFGMAPLRFICCYWGTTTTNGQRYGHYTDASDNDFSIDMYSAESFVSEGDFQLPLIVEREDWEQISLFHVVAETYLEEI